VLTTVNKIKEIETNNKNRLRLVLTKAQKYDRIKTPF
jgi:hypothetical protein